MFIERLSKEDLFNFAGFLGFSVDSLSSPVKFFPNAATPFAVLICSGKDLSERILARIFPKEQLEYFSNCASSLNTVLVFEDYSCKTFHGDQNFSKQWQNFLSYKFDDYSKNTSCEF